MLKKILVVDDDEDVRDMCTALLAENGYSVKTAANGKDALKELKNSVFDLVITDLNMPELDGIGLFMLALKEHEYLKYKFLFFSGDHFSKPQSWPFHQMNLNFIQKPFSIKEFLEKIAIITSLPQ